MITSLGYWWSFYVLFVSNMAVVWHFYGPETYNLRVVQSVRVGEILRGSSSLEGFWYKPCKFVRMFGVWPCSMCLADDVLVCACLVVCTAAVDPISMTLLSETRTRALIQPDHIFLHPGHSQGQILYPAEVIDTTVTVPTKLSYHFSLNFLLFDPNPIVPGFSKKEHIFVFFMVIGFVYPH